MVKIEGENVVGNGLRRFRNEFKLKQNQVADAIKVRPQLYYKYEKGDSVPSVAVIMKIADAFNVSLDYLVGRSDMPKPTNFDEKEVREAFAFRDAWQKAMQSLPQVPAQ